MLIVLRNNSLQLSFIAVRRLSCAPSACWTALCDSHSFSFCPSKPSQSFSYPVTPVSCLPPTLLLNVYKESVIKPQPFRSFSFFSPLSQSLHLPPDPLLFCLSVVEETVVQTNGEKDIRWCTTRLERRMAERQQKRGRYIDWYEGEANYRGLPIRGQSDGSVWLTAASQKHHQFPPCLSSVAARPQLPSAITRDSLDSEGDTVGEHASCVCRHS